MRTPRLPVIDWTDAPRADLNGPVLFADRRNFVSARVPSHFKRNLRHVSSEHLISEGSHRCWGDVLSVWQFWDDIHAKWLSTTLAVPLQVLPAHRPRQQQHTLSVSDRGWQYLLHIYSYIFHFSGLCYLKQKRKGKVIPLQARSGPEGSRKLRFPDYMTTSQDGGKVVSLTHRPTLPPGNSPGTHFC